MKTIVDINTGQVRTMPRPDHISGNLIAFGQIDRLHAANGSGWNPGIAEVERYLAGVPATQIVTHLRFIEGQYVAFWRDGSRLYIFCDRFCLFPVYYRLSGNTLELFDTILDNGGPLEVKQANALAFTLLRYVPGRDTLFDGIQRFMPGDCLIVDSEKNELRIETACAYPRVSVDVDHGGPSMGERAHSLFREAIEMRLRPNGEDEPLLLPLSGGIDSRYLLGTLLELYPARRIIATTFGQPGSYDFEIGRQVAGAVGVRHVAFPLSAADYSGAALEESCRDSDGQINFVTEAPLSVFQGQAQLGRVVLSGLNGDSIMGVATACMGASGRRRIVLRDSQVRAGDPLSRYLDDSLVDDSFFYDRTQPTPLPPGDLWFFVNHLTKYSLPTVVKHRKALTYVSPYMDYALADYMLNLPEEHLHNRRLHLQMLRDRFPKLASLPCNTYRGAAIDASPAQQWIFHQWDRFRHYVLGVNRRVNKIDFFRNRGEVLAPEKLRRQTADILPQEFEERVFGRARYYLLLYNLKCLETLATRFEVKFS